MNELPPRRAHAGPIVVGGVGQLYQGDLDLGRLAAERLERENLGPDVVVEDLSYGAVAVVQRLQDLRPGALVLVGAVERGRVPGRVERTPAGPVELSPAEAQQAVTQAVTGYVDVQLLLDVAAGLGALPAYTVVVEVEPAVLGPGEGLSAQAREGLEGAVRAVRSELASARAYRAETGGRPGGPGRRASLTAPTEGPPPRPAG